MSNEGRGSQQIKRSSGMDFLCSRMLPRQDLETVPFIGKVGGAPIVSNGRCEPEVRRRDVGNQTYHTEKLRGKFMPSTKEESFGSMPTAETLDFLSSQYPGSRFQTQPRYFPV